MPKVTLTDAFITGEGCVCPEGKTQEDYRDQHALGRGLALRVSKNGKKRFTFLYTIDGRERRVRVGEYGRDAKRLSLREARKKVAELRGEVSRGEDPAAAIRTVKETQKAERADTIKILLERRIRKLERAGRRAGYIKDMRGRFNKHILPAIGEKPAAKVTARDVETILEPLEDAGKVSTHNRVLVMLRPLFKLASVPDPTTEIDLLKENESPEPFTLDELARIWRALELPAAKVHPLTAAAIRLSALTIKRSGECAAAMLSEIDRTNNVWTIPGPKMKRSRAETIPLSTQALRIIDAAQASPFRPAIESAAVFPSIRNPEKPITQNALSRAFVRARRVAGIEDDGRTLHGLRHTGATALGASGVAPHIVNALLGHASGSGAGSKVSQRYNQYQYLNERRAALDTLGRWIDEAVTGESLPDNVRAIR